MVAATSLLAGSTTREYVYVLSLVEPEPLYSLTARVVVPEVLLDTVNHEVVWVIAELHVEGEAFFIV